MGSTSDDFLPSLLSRNASWAQSISQSHPDLLPTLSRGQSPKILWLGCSDSRVPETTILNLLPGDVFVHRNVANIVNPTDISLTSVLEFAVGVVKVQHVILCGHTTCGGVAAAMGNKKVGTGVIDTWLLPLRALRRKYSRELNSLTEEEKNSKLVDLNVIEGVARLKENPIVMEAVNERGVKVWGLVYDLGTGKLRQVRAEEGEEEGKGREEAFKTT